MNYRKNEHLRLYFILRNQLNCGKESDDCKSLD